MTYLTGRWVCVYCILGRRAHQGLCLRTPAGGDRPHHLRLGDHERIYRQHSLHDDHDPREVFRILAEIECDYHVLLLESGAIHCLRTDRVKPITAKSLKSMMRCAGQQPNPVIG